MYTKYISRDESPAPIQTISHIPRVPRLRSTQQCRPSEHPPVRGAGSHTFNVLSLQLIKLRRHNKSEIGLSNANPARGHKEVPRSTGHHGDNTLFKQTRIQSATRSLRGPIIREYWKLITALRRDLWVRTTVSTVVQSAASISESELLQVTVKTLFLTFSVLLVANPKNYFIARWPIPPVVF